MFLMHSPMHYTSSGGNKLMWQEDLSICVLKVHQVSMDLLKQPGLVHLGMAESKQNIEGAW